MSCALAAVGLGAEGLCVCSVLPRTTFCEAGLGFAHVQCSKSIIELVAVETSWISLQNEPSTPDLWNRCSMRTVAELTLTVAGSTISRGHAFGGGPRQRQFSASGTSDGGHSYISISSTLSMG